MADWDENSPRLHANLQAVLAGVAASAAKREKITLAAIKGWHKAARFGLDVPSGASVGRFRGEPGLEDERVGVGNAGFNLPGARPELVAGEAERFIEKVQRGVDGLDGLYPADRDLDRDGFLAITELAGWARAQWVRIHPFMNGNGRTARFITNAILMRYGLPPAMRLHPRPDGSYGAAGGRAMRGDVEPTIVLVRGLVLDMIRSPP